MIRKVSILFLLSCLVSFCFCSDSETTGGTAGGSAVVVLVIVLSVVAVTIYINCGIFMGCCYPCIIGFFCWPIFMCSGALGYLFAKSKGEDGMTRVWTTHWTQHFQSGGSTSGSYDWNYRGKSESSVKYCCLIFFLGWLPILCLMVVFPPGLITLPSFMNVVMFIVFVFFILHSYYIGVYIGDHLENKK